MPTTFTSNSAFALSSDTFKTQTKAVELPFIGLKSSTKHDVFVDGINYNWATKQFGKNLGDDLVSDERGRLTIIIYLEIPYEGTVSYDNIIHNTNQNVLIGNQSEAKARNYMTTNKVIEVKGDNSYGKYLKTLRILVNPAHVNRAESHGH